MRRHQRQHGVFRGQDNSNNLAGTRSAEIKLEIYVLAKGNSTQPLLLLYQKVKYYSIKFRDLHCGFIERGKKHTVLF